jgi:hypothetical protein
VSFIKKPPETVTREFLLEEPHAQTLDSYAQFIGSTPDHVVTSALRLVFKKDYEFKRWLKVQKDSQKPLTDDNPNRTQVPSTAAKP